MEQMHHITAEEIRKMSYTDFVGFVNQWNVLPGAHSTISKWKVFGNVTVHSHILEVACTTGFSSREMAILTGCSGTAFDLSEKSVASAQRNKELYAPEIKIDYLAADGYAFQTHERFSHIIIGAALKFFPRPQEMLDRCISFLEDGGCILASPFYIKSPIPESIINEFQGVFGIRPTTESHKDIMQIYRGLEILYEEHNTPLQETEEELAHYCNSTTTRACAAHSISDPALYKTMYDRLYEIKSMSNKLRPYQGYVVLVLRYRSKVYPNRYVELF